MKRASARSRLCQYFVNMVAIALLAAPCSLRGQGVKVNYRIGYQHAFLVLRNLNGAVLAAGDLTQTPYRDRMKVRVVFHFQDGSLDDETTVYSQRKNFRLISDHTIQTGKSFPNPCDIMIDVPAQQVRVHALSKGKEIVTTEHMNLPPDLSNGIIFTLIQNLPANAPRIEVPFLAPGVKPRMVKFAVTQEGEEPFKIAGRSYQARKYDIKVNIGGLAGMIAPMVGKQPADAHVWVAEGAAPVVVRIEGALYSEGPVWDIQGENPVW